MPASEEVAGWGVVATLVSLILTFLVTMSRDRRQGKNEAVDQWKVIADAANVAKSKAEAEVDRLHGQRVQDQREIAALRAEVRHLKEKPK